MSGTITIHSPLSGPYTKQAFGKSVHKGEDACLQQGKLSWSAQGESIGAEVPYGVYGVFDGHGGKQAATFASKHIVPVLQEQLASVQLTTDHQLTDDLEEYKEQLSAEDTAAWSAQDTLLAALPSALVTTFRQVQDQFFEHTQVSGTTATVAAVVGWDLVVASVGDSTALLDTGAEVVQVSGTHRLDDNKTERRRCEEAGCEVCQSTVDGKPVGPKRVWPGGLAMSRTIGDHAAGSVVLCEPEVRRVTLPSQGARLIIASDGLWDAMNPKTAVHHVRGMQASKAAQELVQAALKAKGLRDDITVLVVDALPDEACRLPPHLAKNTGGHSSTLEEVGSLDWHRPLEEAGAAEACQSNTWQRRLEAVRAQFDLSGPASSAHSSATNAADLQSAQSDSMAESTPFETPFTSPQPMAEEDSAEWETVPVKPKREVPTAASDAALPQGDGWGEPDQASDEAEGGWEVPSKQTKVEHQPDSSPEGAVAIKAMHPRSRRNRSSHLKNGAADGYPNGRHASGGDGASSGDANGFANGRQRGTRGRGNRGRGRGRGRYSSSSSYDRQQSSQPQQDNSSWNGATSAATAESSDMDSNIPSSWGAETVFPIQPSPVAPSQLEQAAVPRVLTVRRQQPPRQHQQPSSAQQQHQQQPRRGERRQRGRGQNGFGNASAGGHQNENQGGFVHSVVASHQVPAVQQGFSFGNFEPGDFGSSDVSFSRAYVSAKAGNVGEEAESRSQGRSQRGSGRGRARSGRGGRGGRGPRPEPAEVNA